MSQFKRVLRKRFGRRNAKLVIRVQNAMYELNLRDPKLARTALFALVETYVDIDKKGGTSNAEQNNDSK